MHAVAAAAVAWAMERSPQGGLTGFQAGYVHWLFLEGWDRSYEGKPLRLINYEDMLYPQCAGRFVEVSRETWEWVQERAKEEIYKVVVRRKFGDREILFRRFDGVLWSADSGVQALAGVGEGSCAVWFGGEVMEEELLDLVEGLLRRLEVMESEFRTLVKAVSEFATVVSWRLDRLEGRKEMTVH